MKQSVTFIIHAERFRFAQWLDRFRISFFVRSSIIELGENISLGIIGSPTLKDTFQGVERHEIQGAHIRPDKDDPSASNMGYPFAVLEFELFEISASRCSVKATCFIDALLPEFFAMLKEIEGIWSESGDAINQFFK